MWDVQQVYFCNKNGAVVDWKCHKRYAQIMALKRGIRTTFFQALEKPACKVVLSINIPPNLNSKQGTKI